MKQLGNWMDHLSISKRSNLELLLTQCGVFCIFLQQSGLAVRESVFLSIGYLAQILIGTTIVLVAIPKLQQSIEAQVGIAFIVGSVFIVIVATLKDYFPLWTVFILGALIFVNRKCINALSNWLAKSEETFYQFCVINLILIIFFAGFRRELYFVALSMVVHILFLSKFKNPTFKSSRCLSNSAVYLGALFLLMQFANTFLTNQTYGSKFLRPLYEGSDDQVFSEVMSNSLIKHGLASNMAAAGSEIKYHWFSMLWSGSFTDLTDASPFAVTLHALPLFCIFSTALLIVTLSKFIGPSNRTALLSVCILFFGNSLFDNIPFYYAFSSTNLFSIVVLLSTFIIFVRFFESPTYGLLVFLICLAIMLTLSKAPYMAVLMLGVFTLLFLMRRESTREKKFVVLVVSVVFFAIFSFCYAIFLRADWFNAKYIFSPNFANGEGLNSVLAFLGIGGFVCSRLSIVHGLWNRDFSTSRVTASLCVAVSLVSLSRFMLDGKTSENHLLAVAITLSAPMIAHTFMRLQTSLNISFRDKFIVYSVSILSSFCLLLDFPIFFEQHDIKISQSRFLQSAHPALSVMAAVLVILLIMRKDFIQAIKFAIVLGLSAACLAAYFSYSSVVVSPNLGERVASTAELDLFRWINQNTPDEALLASNRYLCHSEELCDHDDSSQLLAALSRRSVYIEGPRFVSGGHPYANWVSERIELSMRFADNPTLANSALLKVLGVNYYMLDERFTMTSCSELAGLIRRSGPLCLLRL